MICRFILGSRIIGTYHEMFPKICIEQNFGKMKNVLFYRMFHMVNPSVTYYCIYV